MEDLWRAYKFNNDQNARDELLEQCLPLVRSIARRMQMYASTAYDQDDLESMGVMGLIDAVEKFNPTKGAAFKTYATYRIQGAIMDEIRALDWVPRSVRQKSSAVTRTYNKLSQLLGREPDESEIAREMGIPIEDFHQTLSDLSCTAMLTLEDLATEDSEGEKIDIQELIADPSWVGAEESMLHDELLDLLADAIDHLPEREKLLVSLYYNEEFTMKEIGTILDIGESRVSQIHSSAIMRMKAFIQRSREE